MERQVSVEEVSSIEKRILLTIPPFEVQKKLDEILNSVRKEVSIKGYRKGKAPNALLINYLSDRVKPMLSQALIGEHYGHILSETNLVPVSSPRFGDMGTKGYPGVFEPDNSYKVSMTIEVLPTIDPVGYKDLVLEVPRTDAEDMIMVKTREFRDKFAQRRQISDRGAQAGDSVVVDILATIEEQRVEGGSAQGFVMDKIGSGSFVVPEIETALLGMNLEQPKTLTVSFKEDFVIPALAGKEVSFEIVVRGIVEVKPAEVDNDLAAMSGFASVEEFQASIKNEVERNLQDQSRQSLENQITIQLMEKNVFEVPGSMVDSEVERLAKVLKIEKPSDDLKRQLREPAAINVRKAVILNAIYDKEPELAITPQQLDAALDEQAKIYQKSRDEIASLLHGSSQMESFLSLIKTKNVVDYIIRCANTINKE